MLEIFGLVYKNYTQPYGKNILTIITENKLFEKIKASIFFIHG